MTPRDIILQGREAWDGFWKARNRRERGFLLAATIVCVIGLIYSLLIEPPLARRDALLKSLPALRQQAAQMQQLSRQAQQFATAPQAASVALTRDALDASLKNLGLAASSINISERSVQLQFASASLANLLAWLQQVQAQRLSVLETSMETVANTDTVKATVMLTKTEEEQQ
jgi:general secretion pathway protein M